MTERMSSPFPWALPGTAFAVLVLARLTTALTWGWSAAGKLPWNDYGWLRDAVVISKYHTGLPGWSVVADALLANFAVVAPLVLLWETYLFLTLALGFMTRLNGLLATLWAGVMVLLSWSIPKRGVHIPEGFPVPIGGWFWLLGPIVLFPLVAASASGRLWGLDGRLRPAWLKAGGWRARAARWM